MSFIDNIVTWLNRASDHFYYIYLEVYSWVYPFYLAAGFFYQLCLIFNHLAWEFYYFNQWVDNATSKLANILSYANIYSYFTSYFDIAINAWNWVYNAFTNVWDIVDTWWCNTSLIVQGWIDSVRQLLQAQLNSLTCRLTSLQGSWDDFKGRIPSLDNVLFWYANWWGNTLTYIIAWGALTAPQIDSLILSRFKLYEPLWSGWQDIKDKVIEFFTDPEEWLYKAIDRIVERFW